MFKLWQHIVARSDSQQDQEHISVLTLKKVVLAIEGLCFDEIHPNSYPYQLTHQEVSQIFVKFKPLYINRVHQSRRAEVLPEDPTFHPTLCQSSEKLTKHWKEQTRMLPHGSYDMVRSSEEIELLQCTFQPKTNTQSTINFFQGDDKCSQLYEQALQKMRIRGKSFERRDKTSEQYEFEKSQKELTFKPQLCTSRNNNNNQALQKTYSTQQLKEMFTSTSTKSIKGYKIATERIKKSQSRNTNKINVSQPMTVSGNSGTYKNTFSNFPYHVDKKQQSKSYRKEVIRRYSDQKTIRK